MNANKRPYSIAVLISGTGSNLQAILNRSQAENSHFKIACVISNKADAPGIELAKQSNIPTFSLSHSCYSDRESFDKAMINEIDQFEIDLVVLAGFMRILSSSFVKHFEAKLINIHPSLLPKFKGLNTHQRAIESGEKEHGCTVHLVNNELDAGAIIAQAKVTIDNADDASSLEAKVKKQEHLLYPLVIDAIASGDIKFKNQKVVSSVNLDLGEPHAEP